MKYGFVKVATAVPEVKVADVAFNTQKTIEAICTAAQNSARLVVLPELGLTGYTCGDLFFQEALIKQAEAALGRIAEETAHADILAVVGLPMALGDKLYNAAAFIQGGRVLGFATKKYLPNYNEFYEMRHFSVLQENTEAEFCGRRVPIGPKLLFCAQYMKELKVAAEICEDLWAPEPPGARHALAGATVLVNPSAGNETVGKNEYRKVLIKAQSARSICAYLYADAGRGESTTDLVFGGHSMIYENGSLLSESAPFTETITYADLDIARLVQDRRKISTFRPIEQEGYIQIPFGGKSCDTVLQRRFDPHPFVPSETEDLRRRCEEIFAIQCHGLEKRLAHIGLRSVTLGISGGLDSTLALLVTVRAFDHLNLDRSGIVAVTMPCFGTTDRTYRNALSLMQALGVTMREIHIKDAVRQHFKDIGADEAVHDVTYENAQARERTQVLMDIANQTGGIVIGTGDLSELALGFATYNGDHMSMYGVNASVPKTLVRDLVRYVAESGEEKLKETLYDILDTPVSPELLPPETDGSIAQQTEEIVGPYELHDFFLYYLVRWGFSKEKILYLAQNAFENVYTKETIEKWLEIFMRRFFRSQFKRSCMPDGPKVGSVALSPRGDWRMPSDASEGIFR